MRSRPRLPAPRRRIAAAAVAATAVLLAGGASPAAATDCGSGAAAQPFIDHVSSAHLGRSPLDQAKDLIAADDYVLAHTVLVGSMIKPVLSGCSAPASAPMPAHGMPSAPPTPPAAPAATQVAIHDYAFVPAAVTVPAGATVTWVNHDDDDHDVSGSGLKSSSLGKDGTYSFTFATPGSFRYVCSLHPQMKGAVTVQ